jgi:TetR/AcrR family transcriptional regulator, regulator of cefoperazone and chloramphenicol sensitivity
MRSAIGDVTARARIRDAAVLLFGRDGFERTSVRAVADEAKVSPGLVIHHFESKDGLRRACDRFVIEEFLGSGNTPTADTAGTAMQEWLADIDRYRPLLDYLARTLGDDSAAADEFFDGLLAATAEMIRQQTAAGMMREFDDAEVIAAYLTAYGVVPLLLRRQLERAIGAKSLDDLIRRSTLPIVDLYTHGLYADDTYLKAARATLGHEQDNR